MLWKLKRPIPFLILALFGCNEGDTNNYFVQPQTPPHGEWWLICSVLDNGVQVNVGVPHNYIAEVKVNEETHIVPYQSVLLFRWTDFDFGEVNHIDVTYFYVGSYPEYWSATFWDSCSFHLPEVR